MQPRPPVSHHANRTAPTSAEERALADAVRLRRWRQRRIGYLLVTALVGVIGPSGSLAVAGTIDAGSFWNWIATSGWSPLLITVSGGLVGALLVFLRGWGVSLGMITFGVLFMLLVTITRSVSGGLLPAMPGLVALFVTSGALVGYFTALEDGDQ
jgi:hypothetical protein